MDSTLIPLILPALTDLVAQKAPGLVATYPKTALAAATLWAILEFLWPRLPVKGNDTFTVLFHAIKAGLTAALKRKGA